MHNVKKSFFVCLFYLPLIFTFINGHQFVHSDEGDSPEELCLVCQLQQDQEDQEYIPLTNASVSINTPIVAVPIQQFFSTTEKQSVGYYQTKRCRPPPQV